MAAQSGDWLFEQQIDPAQMDRWEVFFEKESIGQMHSQLLLAKLIQEVASGNQQPLKLREIAPWLFSEDS